MESLLIYGIIANTWKKCFILNLHLYMNPFIFHNGCILFINLFILETKFQGHSFEDENYKESKKISLLISYIVTYIYINGSLESKLQTVTRAAKALQLYMSYSQYNNTYTNTFSVTMISPNIVTLYTIRHIMTTIS